MVVFALRGALFCAATALFIAGARGQERAHPDGGGHKAGYHTGILSIAGGAALDHEWTTAALSLTYSQHVSPGVETRLELLLWRTLNTFPSDLPFEPALSFSVGRSVEVAGVELAASVGIGDAMLFPPFLQGGIRMKKAVAAHLALFARTEALLFIVDERERNDHLVSPVLFLAGIECEP